MSTPTFSEGDWVQWDWSGGTARGRVLSVATERPVTVSGTTRDPTEEGEPVYRIEHWNEDSFGNEKVAYESNLRATNEPDSFTDSLPDGCSPLCTVGPCSCGYHDPFTDVSVNGEDIDLVPPEAAQEAAQQALDARDDDDVTVNGMTAHGWSRAEQLASGEELSPSDIVGSSGAMAPWWSRHAQYSINGGDSLSLAGSDADNPWKDNSYTSGKGWGDVAGYKWAIRKGNEIKRARGDNATYSLDDGTLLLEHVAVTDEKIMDTITYDGLSRGDLDEPEIPNEGYEPHYVFDAEIKSDSSYPLVDADGNLRRGNVNAAWELYGQAPDEELLLNVLAQANDRFANADGMSAPIPKDSLSEAMSEVTTDSQHMTDSLQEFIDANDLTPADVVDALDLDLQAIDSVPSEPSDFYDGEATVDELAEDFPAVQMLADDKQDLEATVDELEERVRETERPQYEQTVDELVTIADDAFGSKEELMDAFDAEDEKDRLTVDDVEAKLETAKQIRGEDTTTVTDNGSEDGDSSTLVADNDGTVDKSEIDTTQGGRYDLRDKR